MGKYGEPFAVLPALPLAHYLTNTLPAIPIDWALNAELNFDQWRPQILDRLHDRSPVIFLQRNHLPILDKVGHRFGSWLGRYVRDHWRRIEERHHFFVYVNPNTPDRLARPPTPR